MQLPPQTCVVLRTTNGERVTEYVSFVVGPSRWGIRVTIPQILNQVFTLPASTPVHAMFVFADKFMEFESYVMGYEQTVPPCMVLAEPQVVQEGNRRSHYRLRKGVAVSYLADGQSVVGERTVTADISLGGLAMVTRAVFPRGTPLSINLELPDQTLVISGQVAWSGFRGRLPLTGANFGKMSEANLKILNKYLQSVERESRTV